MASILGSKISDLKSSIVKHGGVARENRFAIYMTPPAGATLNLDLQNTIVSLISGTFKAANLYNDPRDMALLCESCTLPGRQILTADYQSIKQTQKLPYGFVNEDVTFTFLLTEDYYIKKIFDKWSQMVITDRYRMKYHNEYTTDVIIQQLNKENLPVYGVKLLKAYPVTFNPITLDNNSENTAQKYAVTMTFEDYIVEGSVSSALSSVQSSLERLKKLF